MTQRQVKSRDRVADHGEVFTADREVNAMLDLVKAETERIDSRFLEPACGDGNFLAEILRRKLAIVRTRYGKNRADYERYAFLAVTSIYGIDILADNAADCRARLFSIFEEAYLALYREEADDEYKQAVRFVLSRNILHGDALTLKTSEGEPIIFSEWSLVNDTLMKRRDFQLDEMLEGHDQQRSLFTDWEYDEEIDAYIPAPIREFPVTDYRKVHYQ